MTEPSTYTLPNGLAIRHYNRYETDFVYREVFVEQIYTHPFTDLPQAPCVIDVGMNIGLFALFIKQHYPQAQILAFEPSPPLFALASANLAPYDSIQLFPYGLGASSGKRRFTYYPNYSLLSGFHGNDEADRQLLRAGIVQQLQHKEEADAYLDLLTDGKLDAAQHYDCDITTLSAILASKNISRVDLLKIDAEKAELEVLQGIAAQDWPKIRRIVIEAHSRATADAIEMLLRARHYTVSQQLNTQHKDIEIYTMTAQRQDKTS